jgi:hypothetical protein
MERDGKVLNIQKRNPKITSKLLSSVDNHHRPHAALNYKTPKQIYNELTIATNYVEMLITQPIKK